MDDLTQQIADQQAIIDAVADARAVVDLEAQLEAAKNADPVDEALVAQLTGELEQAKLDLADAEVAAEKAEQVMAGLKEELEEAIAAHTDAVEAAAGAEERLDELKAELAVAERRSRRPPPPCTSEERAGHRHPHQGGDGRAREAVELVDSLEDQLEEAKNADPVDEALVQRLTEELEAAKEALAEAEVTLQTVTADDSDDTDSYDTAAMEFKIARESDTGAEYLEETVVLTGSGYTAKTFDDAKIAVFKKVVASLLLPADADITAADFVVETITDFVDELPALGQTENRTESRVVLPDDDYTAAMPSSSILLPFKVYTHIDAFTAAKYLNGLSLADWLEALQAGGLDDLESIHVADSATAEAAKDTETDVSDDVLLSAEQIEAAEEYKRLRDEMYANETEVEMPNNAPPDNAPTAADRARTPTPPRR